MQHWIYLSLAFALFSCTKSKQEQALMDEMVVEMPPQQGYGIKMHITENGKPVKKILAAHVIDSIEGENKEVKICDRGIRIEFFSTEDSIVRQNGVLVADFAKFYDNFETAIVWGDVVYKNHEEGQRLETEELHWEQRPSKGFPKGKIWSYELVKSITEDEILYFDTLIAAPDFSEYELKKVRGSAILKEE